MNKIQQFINTNNKMYHKNYKNYKNKKKWKYKDVVHDSYMCQEHTLNMKRSILCVSKICNINIKFRNKNVYKLRRLSHL